MSAAMKRRMLSRLMPCMYFTHWLFGRLGSGLRRYKYSASCRSTPIKKLYRKDTVSMKKGCFRYGAGVRRIRFCFFEPLLKLHASGLRLPLLLEFFLFRWLSFEVPEPAAGCVIKSNRISNLSRNVFIRSVYRLLD